MALRNILKENAYKELGFGDKVIERNQRLMQSEGQSNVKRKGGGFFRSLNFYHSLITMKWMKFNLIVLSAYIMVNLLFACIYFFMGQHSLGGMIYKSEFERFMETIFFSAQTLSTVGYGRISPTGYAASTVAAIEAFMGLLGFALATGLLYGRFSRPVAKLIFSDKILISPYRDGKALMFRLSNLRKSELIDCEINVLIAHVEQINSQPVRKFNTLKLELTRVNFLSMSWTVVHPIDEESPVKDWSMDDFKNRSSEVLILFKAYEETFAQTVHTRHSYAFSDVVEGGRFVSIIKPSNNGSVVVELDRISEYETVSLQ